MRVSLFLIWIFLTNYIFKTKQYKTKQNIQNVTLCKVETRNEDDTIEIDKQSKNNVHEKKKSQQR